MVLHAPLIAAIKVLTDISTAPSAGVNRMPHAFSAPAANGMANAL